MQELSGTTEEGQQMDPEMEEGRRTARAYGMLLAGRLKRKMTWAGMASRGTADERRPADAQGPGGSSPLRKLSR